MNRDLFIAILSMESYDRGCGQPIREDAAAGQISFTGHSSLWEMADKVDALFAKHTISYPSFEGEGAQ